LPSLAVIRDDLPFALAHGGYDDALLRANTVNRLSVGCGATRRTDTGSGRLAMASASWRDEQRRARRKAARKSSGRERERERERERDGGDLSYHNCAGLGMAVNGAPWKHVFSALVMLRVMCRLVRNLYAFISRFSPIGIRKYPGSNTIRHPRKCKNQEGKARESG